VALAFVTVVLVGTLGLAAATVLGLFAPRTPDFPATHFALGLTSVIVAVFGHCFSLFYFIGVGSALKKAVEEKGLDAGLALEARSIRRKVFPVGGLAIATGMIVTYAGGAVDAGMIPGWVHGTLGVVALATNVMALVVEARLLARNNEIFRRAGLLTAGR